MQTVALHLNYSQYVFDIFLFFETDHKISPTHNLFEFVHRLILIPIGLDVKEILIRH